MLTDLPAAKSAPKRRSKKRPVMKWLLLCSVLQSLDSKVTARVDLKTCVCCAQVGQPVLDLAGLPGDDGDDDLPCRHQLLDDRRYGIQWQLNESHLKMRVELRVPNDGSCWFGLGFGVYEMCVHNFN